MFKWSHCGKAAKLLLFPTDAFVKASHQGLLGDTPSHLSGFDGVWIHCTFQETLVITCVLQDIFIVRVEEEVGLGTLQGFYVVTDWEATRQLSGGERGAQPCRRCRGLTQSTTGQSQGGEPAEREGTAGALHELKGEPSTLQGSFDATLS